MIRFINFILLSIFFVSCNNVPVEQTIKTTKDEDSKKMRINSSKMEAGTNSKTDTLKVLVIPCSNGYEYAMGGYDFNPLIEAELNKATIVVSPFPYKKMEGKGFHGVFDKKYCNSIIEKTDADILVMTRFAENYLKAPNDTLNWGYQIRILNTKTMEQKNSIGSYKLSSYEAIENHIAENIQYLKRDIENIK